MASPEQHRAACSIIKTLLILAFCTKAWSVEFAGGDGTFGNPYQITTARQFVEMGSDSRLLDKCFVLNNDIDFNSHYGAEGRMLRAVIAPHSYVPGFEGWLDGRGHVIRNLRIDASSGDYLGLIGRIGPKGVIVSLGVEDGTIEGGANNAGLLAGSSSGTIIGCWAQGRVQGKSNVGLLVGAQEGGTIAYAYSEGVFSGSSRISGLIGRVADGEVLECSSDCRLETVEGVVYYCGGLVGELVQGTVEGSFARVDLAWSQGHAMGGLVGFNGAGLIRGCLSLGTIRAGWAGGLVGTNNGTIRSCYSLCEVEAVQSAGGLINTNHGTVMWCYAAGSVKAPNAGGLIQQGNGAFLSYWDVDKSGVLTSVGGFGRTAAQMRQAATFRGWGRGGEWVLPEGDTPRLWWEPCWGTMLSDEPVQFPGGCGTEEDPYQIQTAAEFASLAWNPDLLDKHFVLTRDVNLAELDSDAMLPIGTGGLPFCGSLDGRGHILSGLACDVSSDCVGLFGWVGTALDDPNRTGSIRNLTLQEAQVAGGRTVGALTACLDGGRIERCFVTGQVQGDSIVGGAIGQVLRGEVVESAFEGRVDGQDTVGGLIGFHQGVVRSCYSAGQVTGEKHYVGGLVGKLRQSSGSPSRPVVAFCYSHAETCGDSSVGGLIGSTDNSEVFSCYATGKVHGSILPGGLTGSVSGVIAWGNVWDRENTGMSTSAFGQSQTTSAMMSSQTYAGWEYGRQWTLKAGVDYPRLAWEGRAGTPLVNPARSYGGGNGTYSNPYLISQGEHLVTLSRHPQDFCKHFRLTRDIDLQAVQADLSPIGTLTVPFTGTFDGNHHTLKSLKHTDSKTSYSALFRSIQRSTDVAGVLSGLVSNLHLDGASVKADKCAGALAAHNAGEILFCTVSRSTVAADQSAGGLVAHNGREGTLLACESAATVTLGGVVRQEARFQSAGGLVALNEGALVLCSSSASVTGKRDATSVAKPMKISVQIGGLVGANQGGTITGCTTTSHVVGFETVGGLVGLNENGWVYRCGATTDVDVRSYGGGLVAESVGGDIAGCFARGKVTGNNLGGFIATSRNDVIESCYFDGSIRGAGMGGFVGGGYEQSRISECYCVADIQGVSSSSAFARYLNTSVQVSNCFWDKTVFAENRDVQSVSAAQRVQIKGVDTESLQGAAPLREAGWDFVGTWVQCAGDYPRLWWEQVECTE